MHNSLTRRCIACGCAFGSSNREKKLCHSCEVALERLNDYVVSVVRCKDCRYWRRCDESDLGECDGLELYGGMSENDFCSYGERREYNA